MEMDSKRNRVEFDRINELQDDILIHIFSFLSIEDNVRASFVCTRWKSLWSPLSVLDLDCISFCKNFKNLNQEAQKKKFTNFVSSVLVLDQQHQEHLEELQLAMDLCKFVPPRYGCFESLQIVTLRDAVLVENAVNDLIDRCPVLEGLYLIGCTVSSKEFDVSASTSELKCLVLDFSSGFKGQVYSVNICVPSLEKFKYVGDLLDNFYVGDFDNLIEAHIYFTKACFSYAQSRSLHNMIGSFGNVNTLTLDRWSLKLLGTVLYDPTELDGNLPCPFSNLKHLRLRSSLGDSELVGLHRLVRSSPSIETLSVKLSPSRHYPDNFWELQSVPFDCLQHLKIIEIKGFNGLISEMKFLKYMFANALVLKKIIIDKAAFRSCYILKEQDEVNQGLFFANQEKAIEVLLGFTRASHDAQILLL